jgi:hypothetical protein
LILWLNLVLHKSFLGLFEATCWNLILVYEPPCCIQSFCFSFHHLKSINMKWSDIKTNSYIWDSLYYNK